MELETGCNIFSLLGRHNWVWCLGHFRWAIHFSPARYVSAISLMYYSTHVSPDNKDIVVINLEVVQTCNISNVPSSFIKLFIVYVSQFCMVIRLIF